jgi:ubiquinone/menaquinone biosynthesis C-methylase UbiE
METSILQLLDRLADRLPPPLVGRGALYYNRLRTLNYVAQSALLMGLATVARRKLPPKPDSKLISAIQASLEELLSQDARNIAENLYPISVLGPENWLTHMARLPRILRDGWAIESRRKSGRTTEFASEAKDFLDDLPRYYRRNFHFQTDGYLSEESAELYEHQVEILFRGAADAMRRLAIRPLKENLSSHDGKGLSILEIAAGTGSATRFMHAAFPKAKLVATEISDPYLKRARKRLGQKSHVDFVQADAAKLPFKDSSFDAVYSVFLFHELPMEARESVIVEAARVLKPGGVFVLVDSLQLGDRPELDEPLLGFPQEFHEPFFRNYLEHPMEALCTRLGLQHVESSTGFFSKVVRAKKGQTV